MFSFLDMCKDDMKMIVRVTFWWPLDKWCEFSKGSKFKTGKFLKPNSCSALKSQRLEEKELQKKKKCREVEAGC